MTKTKLDILKSTLLHTTKNYRLLMIGETIQDKATRYRKTIKNCTDINQLAISIRTQDEYGEDSDVIYRYKNNKFVLMREFTTIYALFQNEYTFDSFIDIISRPDSAFQVTGVSRFESLNDTTFYFVDLWI